MSNPTPNSETTPLRLKLAPRGKPMNSPAQGALEPELLDLIRAIARAHAQADCRSDDQAGLQRRSEP
jgi:hypothetical protein